MTVKQQAMLDIKSELKREHKSFIPYVEELDTIMDSLVGNYINNQNNYSHV